MPAEAGENQCEVVLVGCGAPSRGMGWYHAEQMLKGKCPSAKLCYIVEPWFLGAGACGFLLGLSTVCSEEIFVRLKLSDCGSTLVHSHPPDTTNGGMAFRGALKK